MDQKDAAIGIFDSGVGGVSVLSEVARLLPQEHLYYMGDNAHAPYGTKRPEEVRTYCMRIVEEMQSLPVKAVVIACNTASSVAAPDIRATFDFPVIAMEPALKPAHMIRKNGRILVLATPVTLSLPKFRHLYDLYGEGAEAVPCPGLMELVEKEDDAGAKDYLERIFSRYDLQTLDAVVLGCTHYVFLRDMVISLLPEHTAVLDGNLGTARQLKRVLENRGMLRESGTGTLSFHSTGDETMLVPLMQRLYARLQDGSRRVTEALLKRY